MDWAQWQPTDAAIRQEFGYDVASDRLAAQELHRLVPATNRFRDLGVLVRNRRNIVVVGAGPSLASANGALLAGKVIVAADGATTWLREQQVTPHIVVTDLDGAPEDLAWAAKAGAPMVVHAHGDNRQAIRDLVPALLPQVYGTYQGPPHPELTPMQNVGGFTDGDRAVVLCEALGAREAVLLGFDFDSPPSAYSYKWDARTKPAKLAWAKRIVDDVVARGALRISMARRA